MRRDDRGMLARTAGVDALKPAGKHRVDRAPE